MPQWHRACLRDRHPRGPKMFRVPQVTGVLRLLAAPLVLAATVMLAAAPASAQTGHRARLSGDLVERIKQRVEAPADVIVAATDAGIDRLVTRYGAKLKKRIHGGAVLEATGGQIDAMSQDPDASHMAGDVPVHRMMAVTTQSTGADQVWAGLEGARGVTGKGIGVAVIDSGIAAHGALKDRVVASVDFTE